jgi:hypothetical protein
MIARDLQPKKDVKGGGVLRMNPKQAARALQAPEAATNKFSRSHDAVIRVCDAAGNMIETHEHAGDFREW